MKAIIPAAGFGTRMLPATKAIPKEMLPVVDKPTIQYIVEEAVEAGIDDILIIISKGKQAIQEHFSPHPILEQRLLARQKEEILETVKASSNLANVHFIYQKELNGLGDAVRYAENHVGDSPFMLMMGDSILESSEEQNITQQLIHWYHQTQSSIVALQEVPNSEVFRYGVIDGLSTEYDRLYRAKAWIEKPQPENAPSNLVVSGRYLFTPTIFKYLHQIERGVNNEYQITDAMRLLLQEEKIYGWQIKGQRHDIGKKLDFIKTNVLYGLKDKVLGEDLKNWIKELAEGL